MKILDAAEGTETEDFPYPNYPESFPEDRFSFRKCSDERLVELGDWNEESDDVEVPRHEFGGQPRLWHPMHAPTCGNCKMEMQYLGTVADKNTDPRGFTDNVGVMMVYFLCPYCSSIYATNQVD